MNPSETPAPPLACDLSAIPADAREAHLANTRALFETVRRVDELGDGYRFELSLETATLQRAAAFIANEHRCCPFFRFALVIEPAHQGLWLALTGGDGVKAFALAEFGPVVAPEALAQVSSA